MYEVLHPQQLSHIKDSNLLIFTYKILCKDIFYKRSFKYSDGYYVPVSWCKINSCWFIIVLNFVSINNIAQKMFI